MEHATIDQVKEKLFSSESYTTVLLGFQLDLQQKANEFLAATDYFDDFADHEDEQSDDEDQQSDGEESESDEIIGESNSVLLEMIEGEVYYFPMEDGRIGTIKGPGTYKLPVDIVQLLSSQL